MRIIDRYDYSPTRAELDMDDARAEFGSGRRYRYNCGGPASWSGPCGAPDCGSCKNGPLDDDPEDREAFTSETRVARKARRVGMQDEIRPGDIVQVHSGFTYAPGGKRTGYFKRYYRLRKGPAWGVNNG